jgi:O-antigen ligase
VRAIDLRCFRVRGARYATTAELVTPQPAVLWRALPARALVAIAPLWLTIAVLVLGAPQSMKLAVGAMLAVSIASPYAGLLAVAATVPLADYIGIILNLGSYRLGEAITIAFLSGWLIRGETGRPGPRVAGGVGWALAVAIVASMVGTAVRFPGALREAANWAFYGYYLSVDPSGWVDGARLLEGIALVVAVFAMFRRRPQLAVALPAALTIAATAAGATSILLWYRVAPAVILQRHALIGYRYTAHVADVNGAGSYFALSVCLALAMAVRVRGRSQLPWLVATAVCAVAAWLAASRTANAVAIVAVCGAAAWWVVADWSQTAKTILAVAATIVVIGVGVHQLRELARDPDYRGADFRRQFTAASLRMVAAAPLSGIGVGQYKQASTFFMAPQVAYSYGSENAHNYFLQLTAELGVIGLAILLCWLITAVADTVRAAAITPRDIRLLGLIAGVAAFAATCATGHPLLLTEIAVPFWLAFGIMWALADSVLINGEPRERSSWPVIASAAAATVFVGAQLGATDTTLRPPESRAVTGLYEWETDTDGSRYRWSGEYGSVFVPADVTRVYIPVRVPPVASDISPMRVEARTEGKPGTPMTVGGGWAVFNLELPNPAPNARFKRINLHADRTWKPAMYRAGSADMRDVSVQVGELKLFRE